METPTTRSPLPRILGALTVVTLLASIPFLVLGLDTPLPETAFGFRGWELVLGSAFLLAGVLIAMRVPANPIADRLAALGGELPIRSSLGVGSTIVGSVHVGSGP